MAAHPTPRNGMNVLKNLMCSFSCLLRAVTRKELIYNSCKLDARAAESSRGQSRLPATCYKNDGNSHQGLLTDHLGLVVGWWFCYGLQLTGLGAGCWVRMYILILGVATAYGTGVYCLLSMRSASRRRRTYTSAWLYVT